MAEREPTWWDYVKAAFRFRLPFKWLGGLPLNQIMLYTGALFAVLFLVARQTPAAGGVLLLTGAAELGYLYLLSTTPRFRELVRAETMYETQASKQRTVEDVVRRLGRSSIVRYQRLMGVSADIERLLTERQGSSQAPWAEALKTGGLTEINTMFARLLEHHERVQAYLASSSALELPKQLRQMEDELKTRRLADPVRRSKEQTLEVLKKRAEQLAQMAQSGELAAAELERLEQHLALLRDQAAGTDDVMALAGRIDDVVSGVSETADWLLESERLLADPNVGEETVSA